MNNIRDMLSVLDGKKENASEELDKSAQGVRDIYLAYIRVGFTSRQSMELVNTLLTASIKK